MNLIKSGRNWYGDLFDNVTTYNQLPHTLRPSGPSGLPDRGRDVPDTGHRQCEHLDGERRRGQRTFPAPGHRQLHR